MARGKGAGGWVEVGQGGTNGESVIVNNKSKEKTEKLREGKLVCAHKCVYVCRGVVEDSPLPSLSWPQGPGQVNLLVYLNHP